MLLEGKEISENILRRLKSVIINQALKPGLAVILIGNDPASHLYAAKKEQACRRTGIHFKRVWLPETINSGQVARLIEAFNKNKHIHGIVVQLPLPGVLKGQEDEIIAKIAPGKDVDGFSGKSPFEPPCVRAVLRLLAGTKRDFSSSRVLILARGREFSRKLKEKLSAQFSAVEIHLINKKEQIPKSFQGFDVLISALGMPQSIPASSVLPEQVIIDVGTTLAGKKILGDFERQTYQKAAFISPVPGGIGPLTVAYLLENVVASAARQAQKDRL